MAESASPAASAGTPQPQVTSPTSSRVHSPPPVPPTVCGRLMDKDEVNYGLSYRVHGRLLPRSLSGEEGTVIVVADGEYGGTPLEKLLLTDIPRSRPTTAADDPDSLPSISAHHIRITCVLCVSNAVHPEGLERFVMRTTGRYLTSLILEDCSLRDAGAGVVAAGLERNVKGTNVCRITHLSLGNNYIGSKGACLLATAVRTNTQLQVLNMDWNTAGAQGAGAFAASLLVNSTLIKLDLEANDLRDEGVTALGRSLSVNRGMQDLAMDSCSVTSAAVAEISKSLRVNTTLRSLSLAGNGIGSEGANSLCSELAEHNSSLTSLRLDQAGLGEEFLFSLAGVLRKRHCSLRAVRALGNRYNDEGAKILSDALSTNTSLSELCLARCGLGTEAVDAISRVAGGFGRLKVLDLSGNAPVV